MWYVVDCEIIAQEIINECKSIVQYQDRFNVPRRKLLIVSNDDKASQVYVRNKVKACEEVGIMVCVSNSYSINQHSNYDAVIIQLPNEYDRFINDIPYQKDVDGLCNNSIAMLQDVNTTSHIPATPKGILRLLEHTKEDLDGKHVVIVGRSNIVGRPLARLLEMNNATVTICHSHTKDLKSITKQADILVTAIGKPKYFDDTYIKDGCCVVDVGINRDENNKLCGDCDTLSMLHKCKWITPVPRGIGKLTVAELIENIIATY